MNTFYDLDLHLRFGTADDARRKKKIAQFLGNLRKSILLNILQFISN